MHIKFISMTEAIPLVCGSLTLMDLESAALEKDQRRCIYPARYTVYYSERELSVDIKSRDESDIIEKSGVQLFEGAPLTSFAETLDTGKYPIIHPIQYLYTPLPLNRSSCYGYRRD